MNKKVSIIVISYNSEKTILETLNSILLQTYKNIEVIVSDDRSNDKTLEIIENWIKKNSIQIKLIKSDKNNGVSKNINYGLKVSEGEWIKIIAADDILLPDCLEKNIKFIEKNPDVNICFSKSELFGDCLKETMISPKNIEDFYLSPKEQNNSLKSKCFVPAPTSFIKREIFNKYGFFDERVPMIEDWPYWLKITSLGEKLYFLDEVTVKYRVGETLSQHQNKIVSEKGFKSKKLIYKYYLKDNINFILKWHYLLNFFITSIVVKLFNNTPNKISKGILKYSKILDPYSLFNYYKREKNEK